MYLRVTCTGALLEIYSGVGAYGGLLRVFGLPMCQQLARVFVLTSRRLSVLNKKVELE